MRKRKNQEDFSENAKNFWKNNFLEMTPEENKGGSIENTILSFLRYKLGFLTFYFFIIDLDEQALPCISHILTSLNVRGVTC